MPSPIFDFEQFLFSIQSPMRFLILGATGSSGILFVRKALEVYPDATTIIFARSPNKLPADLKDNTSVTIIQGTLDDLDKLESAVQDVHVVLSALGPAVSGTKHPDNTPIATFYGHLIDLMYKHNVKRFISLSTPSIADPKDKSSWKFAAMMKVIRALAYTAYTDIMAMGDVVKLRGKDLDWTLVRVPYLTNGKSEGVVAGHKGDGKVGVAVSRKAFAAFSIGEIENRKWVKGAPLISNA